MRAMQDAREAVADGVSSRDAELRTFQQPRAISLTSHLAHRFGDPQLTAQLLTLPESHISVSGLCDGQVDSHKYIWSC